MNFEQDEYNILNNKSNEIYIFFPPLRFDEECYTSLFKHTYNLCSSMYDILPAAIIYTIILLGDETNKEVNFYHTLSFYLTFRIVHHIEFDMSTISCLGSILYNYKEFIC